MVVQIILFGFIYYLTRCVIKKHHEDEQAMEIAP